MHGLEAGLLFSTDGPLNAKSKIKEKEISFPHQKNSLPDCHENTSHRGAGSLSMGALVHTKLMPSVEEKEKFFPSSK
jgi:hypothetical protein